MDLPPEDKPMRKTLMAAALAIPMALLTVSTLAATPAEQPQAPTPIHAAQTRLVSQYLTDEIFLPTPELAPAPAFSAFGVITYGVCSVTCEECYGPYDCPSFAGIRQYCTYACN